MAGAWQTLLHAPQLVTVVLKLMHAAPHLAKPALHAKPHVPAEQVPAPFDGAVQTVPHVPQFDVSVETVTHEPLQLVVPEGHDTVQTPPEQTWFAPHAFAQAPQFDLSDCSSTQLAPHAV